MSLSIDDDWLKPQGDGGTSSSGTGGIADLHLPPDLQLPDLGRWWVDLEFLDLASGPPAHYSSASQERNKNRNPTLGYNFPDIFFDTTSSTSLFDDNHRYDRFVGESLKDHGIDFEKGILADLFPSSSVSQPTEKLLVLLSIKPTLCFVYSTPNATVFSSKILEKLLSFSTMSANHSNTQQGAQGMEATDPSQGAAAQPPHAPSQSVIQSPVEPETIDWGWYMDGEYLRESARRVELEEEVAELRRKLEILETEKEIARLCARLDVLNQAPVNDQDNDDDEVDQAYAA